MTGKHIRYAQREKGVVESAVIRLKPEADTTQTVEQRKRLLFSLSLKDAHVFACTCVWKQDTHYINKANGFLCLICLAAEEIRSGESRSPKQPGSLQFSRRE